MVRFTLRQCNYFIAVAEEGGIAKAARRLHVSEPALANAMTKFETALGITLIERLPARGIRLTAAGRDLLPVLHRLSDLADDTDHAAAGLASETGGRLRVGCFPTIAPFVLPTLIKRLAKPWPALQLEVSEDWHSRLIERLIEGELDLALAYAMSLDPAKLAWTQIASLSPCAILPTDHPLADRQSIALIDLARSPLVLFDVPGSSGYFLDLFARVGLTPQIALRSQSMETVRSAVGQGLGVSISVMRPPSTLTYDGGQIRTLPIDAPVPTLDVIVVWRQGTLLTQARRDFIQMVKQFFVVSGDETAIEQ